MRLSRARRAVLGAAVPSKSGRLPQEGGRQVCHQAPQPEPLGTAQVRWLVLYNHGIGQDGDCASPTNGRQRDCLVWDVDDRGRQQLLLFFLRRATSASECHFPAKKTISTRDTVTTSGKRTCLRQSMRDSGARFSANL